MPRGQPHPEGCWPGCPGASGQAGALSALDRLRGQPPEPRGCWVPDKGELLLGDSPKSPVKATKGKDPMHRTEQNVQKPRINLTRRSRAHAPFSRKETRGNKAHCHLSRGQVPSEPPTSLCVSPNLSSFWVFKGLTVGPQQPHHQSLTKNGVFSPRRPSSSGTFRSC